MAKETPLKGVAGAFKQLRMDLQLALNTGGSSEKIEYRPYPTNNPRNKWHEKGFLQPKFRGDWQELLVCQKCFLVADANNDSVSEHIRKRINGTSLCERLQDRRKAQPRPSNSAKQQPDPKPKPQPPLKSRKPKKKSKKPDFLKNMEECYFCGQEFDWENRGWEHWYRCFNKEVVKYNPEYAAYGDIEERITRMRECEKFIKDFDGECGSDLEISDTPDSGEEEDEATFSDSASDADYKPPEESPSGSRSGDSRPEESPDDTAAEGASVQPMKVDYTEFYRCGSTERFGRKQIQCEECFLYFEEKYYFLMHNQQRTRDGFDAEKGKGKTPEEHPQDLFLPDVLPTTKDDRVMCPWKNCFKTFSTESKLEKHWRSHTSEKPHACRKCGQTFGKSSGATWCEQMHSFKYTKEQVQQMVNVNDVQLTYCHVSVQVTAKININYWGIIVDGKLAPYVVCIDCFEVVARIDATSSGHDCKATANDGKGRIDIPPPDVLSSCFKYEMSDVNTRELDEADPLRKRFLYVLYKDNETGCIKCRGCSAVFPKNTGEMSNINAHVCPAAKKRA